MEVPERYHHQQQQDEEEDESGKTPPASQGKLLKERSAASISSKFKALMVIACIVLALLRPEGNFLKSLLPSSDSEVRSIKTSNSFLRSDSSIHSDKSHQQQELPGGELVQENQAARPDEDNQNKENNNNKVNDNIDQEHAAAELELMSEGEPEFDIVFKPPVETTTGGLFFCGYDNYILGRELFPDYWHRYRSGYDPQTLQDMSGKGFNPTRMRPAVPDDILIFGLHGPCGAQPRTFPGKLLVVNGEPHGPNMPENVRLPGKDLGEDVYQIGPPLADSEHSILAFHGAWNMMRFDEGIWDNIFDPKRKPKNTGKYNALMYMNRQCVGHREEAVRRIANVIPVHHGGPCHGNSAGMPNFVPMPNPPPGNHWTYNVESYREYKFCLSMENSKTEHYMSEKILVAFHAGCIPIYYGSSEVLDVINKDAFIWYEPDDPTPALRQIQELSTNETAYLEMLNQQPIMAHGSESVKQYFSFSDRIEFGYLKNKLRKVMNLPVPIT